MADQEVLIRINTDASGAVAGIDKVKSSMSGMADHGSNVLSRLKAHWLGLSVAIGGAMYGISKAWSLAEAAAGYIEQMQQLDALARKYDTTSISIVNRIREIGDGMISMTTASQVGLSALGKGLDPRRLYDLAEAAVTLKDIMGTTADEAFTRLSEAEEANKQKSLKLAIGVIDLKDRYGDLADKMTEVEKQTAFHNMIMEKTHEIQQRTGKSAKSVADEMETLKTRVSDLKIEMGINLIRASYMAYGAFQYLAAGALGLAGNILYLAGAYAKYRAWVYQITGDTKKEAENTAFANEAMNASKAAWEARNDLMKKASDTFDLATISTEKLLGAQGKASAGFDNMNNKIYNTKEEAERLMEQWNRTKITLAAEIEKKGMSDFEIKILDIKTEAEQLENRFKKLPPAVRAVAYEMINAVKDVKIGKVTEELAKSIADMQQSLREKASGGSLEDQLQSIQYEYSKLREKIGELPQDAQAATSALASLAEAADIEKAYQNYLKGAADYYSNIIGYEEIYRKKQLEYIERVRLAEIAAGKDETAANIKAYQERGKLEQELFEKKTKYISDGFGLLQSAFTDIASLYKDGSEEAKTWEEAAKAMETAQRAVAVATAIATIANQGLGDPYTAFYRIATMAAAMGALLASIGESVGGTSGTATVTSSSRSTVLGAEAGTGSESIANSLNILTDTYNMENLRLRNIYEEIRNLNDNIIALVTSITRTGGIDYSSINVGSQDPSWWGGRVGYDYTGFKALDTVIGWVEDLGASILDSLFGGVTTTELVESGIAIGNTAISNILKGVSISAQKYALIRTTTSGGLFEGDDVYGSYIYDALDSSVTRMLTLVYKGLSNNLVYIAEELGGDVQKVYNYAFQSKNLNLQGLSADEMNKTLSEYFSAIADTAVETLFGDMISQYQQLNEGLMETAIRLISDKETIAKILELTNQTFHGTSSEFIKFSESLIKVAGGLDKLTDAFGTYYDAFFTDAEKQADYKKSLTSLLSSYGYALPTERIGYRDIVESLKLKTDETAQAAYYAMMAVADTADKYYDYLESAKSKINPADYATSIEYQKALAGLPHYADGGYTPGGWAMVGEQGPEPVYFDSSARVISNKDSKTLFNIDALIAELRATREEIRRGNATNSSYNQKTYEMLYKFDRVGMPAERTQ